MSATMGFEDVANLTHNLENVLDGIRNDDISVHTQTIDIMFEAVDHLNAMVDNIASGGDGKRNVKQVLEHLEQLETGNQIVSQEVSHNSLATNEEQTINKLDQFEMTILDESIEQGYKNYEIYVQIRNDCLLKGVRVFMVFEALEQFGEVIKSEPPVVDLEEEKFEDSFVVLLVTKSSADEIRKTITQISEIEKVSVNPFSLSDYRTEQNKDHQESEIEDQDKTEQNSSSTSVRQAAPRKTIRVNIERLDALMNLFEELVIDRGRLEQIATEINHTDLRETVDHMTRISGDLQDVILNMRMVPISQVFNRFPGMVRQISRDLNKKINLEIIGAETELDRTVIDEIGDPLVHLIRNAADHGIELPEERRKKGKPDQGTIKLVAYHSGNFVFIEIEDDGAGINKKVVLDKAINNGVISIEQSKTLSDEQIYE